MSYESATDEIDSMLQGLRIDARTIEEHIAALTKALHTATGNRTVVEMKIERLSALLNEIHAIRQNDPGVSAEADRTAEGHTGVAPLVSKAISSRRIRPVVFWSVGVVSLALLVLVQTVREHPVGASAQDEAAGNQHASSASGASSTDVPAQLVSTTNTTPVVAAPVAQTSAVAATLASQPSETSSVPNSEAFNADDAIAAATRSFQLAAQQWSAAGASCEPAEIAKILNLQKIEFDSGSEQIPSSARDNLRVSAQLLKSCVEQGHPIRLQVAAFSDNGGSEEANLHLSHKRAVAVRAHLVEAGEPGHLLTAKGYGEERPVAGNDTARGRFLNRRIEFVPVSP
ncbi:OmpA family protein [Paraburkholderia monticola]|uniref:OmpA family protein n=1 Tax=Paraburkholderia monticola TaxID=1399968 RepID=UPI00137A108E|nr:OmpA family protein [Paraburkholderia monticola]